MGVEYELRNAAGMRGNDLPVAVTQLRSTIVSDEVRQWIKEGRVFQGFEGVLTDPKTFAVVTLIRRQPQFMIRVPAGIVIIPLMSMLAFEATANVTHGVQVLVSCCNNDPGVDGNMDAITPVNVNTRFSLLGSAVAAYGTNSGNVTTAPSGVADLYREYHHADRDAITGAPTPPITYSPRDGHGQECAIGDDSNVNAYLFYGLSGNNSDSTGFSIHTWAEFAYDEYYGS